MARPHIAFFMASLGKGGIGRMRLNLTRELVRRGVRVDLVLGDRKGPYFGRLDPGVRVFDIGTSHPWFCLPKLIGYLKRERPPVLVTERIRVNQAALRAKRFSGVPVRVFAGLHTAMSHEIDNLRPDKQRSQGAVFRRCYPLNDGFISVSRGVADDFIELLDVAQEKVKVVYNPVVNDEFYAKADEPVDHEWFAPSRQAPVLLAAGRLEPQKDFPSLIEAFSNVRKQRPCRLLILGEGSQRSALEEQAAATGFGGDIDLPGHQVNPYRFMRRADLFVLSSAWEGSPNALTEALACGTPVVATDCNSGPMEILDGGRFGPLVPVGDVTALTAAIIEVLDHPHDRAFLQSAAARFTVENCADSYLAALGFGPFTA
jgi:glycosyltransferase involved in cell wall biosynthesis